MIFESLWPLAFLAAVPAIIILYLLKPKGKDLKISSSLLWQKLFVNHQSKTFLEKFVHNVLMYLQILIVILLAIALMSPYITVNGVSKGNIVFLMDTSGSMQMKNSKGQTRMEEAIEAACNYVDAADNSTFSVVSNDEMGTKLVVVGSSDKSVVKNALKNLTPSDAQGNLAAAESTVETLYGGKEEDTKSTLVVFTDADGAEDTGSLVEYLQAEVAVVGETGSNLANNFLAYTATDNGFDVACSVTNYSDKAADFEVALYDGDNKLIELRSVRLEPMASSMCVFRDVVWEEPYLKSVISNASFDNSKDQDCLSTDDISYVAYSKGNDIAGLLVGDGNTYLEKAYTAVVGKAVTKYTTDTVASNGDYNVVIYDAGTTQSDSKQYGSISFGNGTGSAGTIENVLVFATEGTLTSGLSDYQIGVNKAYYFEVPEWGHSFLEYDGKCIGYYGEDEGVKKVVVGFDLRESDFPLKAEFPIFMANALNYLSDTSLLGNDTYYAGEAINFQPKSDVDITKLKASTEKAGIYEVAIGEYDEYYVVRYKTSSESDATLTAEGTVGAQQYTNLKVKKTLRNIFLALVILLYVAEWIIYVKQMRYRGKFYLFVRIAGVVLLILAMTGVSLSLGSKKTTTVFVVDLSNSNEQNREEMSSYLGDVIRKMPSKNEYGVVCFGKSAQVEQFLTNDTQYAGLMTTPDLTATNYEEAISRALAMLPNKGAGRIVVLTDGKQTKGDVDNTAKAIVANDVELLSCFFESSMGQDAYVDSVKIPSYLHPGDTYSVTVNVDSNYDTDAVLEFIYGSMVVNQSAVHLNKGTNQFVMQQTVEGENIESFSVRVTAPEDTCEENNTYHIFSVVESNPKVLVIAGMGEDTQNIKNILDAAGGEYEIVSALNAPDTLSEMLEYKSIIMQNVFAGDLPDGFIDNLDSYVKDYGCGFICCGGEKSYALGAYRQTAIEDVLPVKMELQGVDEVPSMAMVMVIDHSGSMLDLVDGSSNQTNLDLAIDAAMVAVDNLRPTDYVGVLTFDDEYSWNVAIVEASNKDVIKNQIAHITDGGGTTIKPALNEALREIGKCDAAVKHVVLLTDGMGETTNFNDVITSYSNSGVTLSTVAVGEYSDTTLLENLANGCGGRYYYSDRSTDIPSIFAQEVFLGGDSFIQNGEFALKVRTSNEIASGLFDQGWPMIYGYICASPKTASTVIAATNEKEDPILTVWQYGLGHTVAWNTDITSQWTAGYAGRDDYVTLWRRIIDYSVGNNALGEDSADVTTANGTTTISYTAEGYDDKTEVSAVYTDPDGGVKEVKLYATAPGKYETEIDTDTTGVYNFSVRRTDGENITNAITTAAVVQFSDEYKFDVTDAKFRSFVESYGKEITTKDNIWTKAKRSTKESKDFTKLFMILAFLLFLADVAMRRLHLNPITAIGNQKAKSKSNRVAKKAMREELKAQAREQLIQQQATQQAAQQIPRRQAATQPVEAQRVQQPQSNSFAQPTASPMTAPVLKENQKAQKTLQKEQEKARKKAMQEAKKAANTTSALDTSSLLKKKDNRNM